MPDDAGPDRPAQAGADALADVVEARAPGTLNLAAPRDALRDALAAERLELQVEEIDVEAPDAPEWARGWGSPTILIDRTDLTGATRSTGASCRLYQGGTPGVEEIRARIGAARRAPAATGVRVALPMLGAITAALAASACCLVPAVLAVVGLSGAGGGAALAPYRVCFLTATAAALGARSVPSRPAPGPAPARC